MGLRSTIDTDATTTIFTDWKIRDGRVVPESGDLGLIVNDAVKLDAAYLYADLRDSSRLAQMMEPIVAATAIRSYLQAASTIIKHHGGKIRSFDGDRVMGIYIGDSKRNDAVTAAQHISWALEKVLRPKLELNFPGLKKRWHMDQGIGIDCGETLLVRGGVRRNNDLVSIGSAPNVAAKLSDLKNAGKQIFVTSDVYHGLKSEQRDHITGGSMWEEMQAQVIGGRIVNVFCSAYHRAPGD